MAAVMMIAGGGIAGDALAEAFRLTIFVPDGVRKDGTGFATAIRETFHSVDTLTGGMGLIAGATIAIALAAGAYGFVQVWRSERSAEVRGQALMLALSLFIPPLWCVFFLNLMINHSWFTDRIFVWLIAGGFSLFFLDLLSRGKGRETA